MPILYFSPGSSSMAPHIALHEIGAPFETRLVPLHQEANRQPEYLALNPEGKVPTLVIDGHPPLTEVAGILWYLARAHPAAGLLPQYGDDAAEARVVSWMSFVASTIHPSRRAGRERWRQAFELAETRLAREAWCVGHYSIADIHLFRLFWRYVDSEHPAAGTFPRADGALSAHAGAPGSAADIGNRKSDRLQPAALTGARCGERAAHRATANPARRN